MNQKTSQNPRSIPHPTHGAERLYYLYHSFQKKAGRGMLAKLFKRINQLLFHVNIQPTVRIGKNLELAHGGVGIVIHADTVIGDDAIIFHNVTIGNGGARIGDRVYIGTGAVIIGDVKIGDDVVIGANAVVNFDIPDGCTVVGSKATLIKKNESISSTEP